MDLQKIISFKTSSKRAITIQIFLVLFSTVLALILINLLLNIFLPNRHEVWAPEALYLFLFGLLVIWIFVVFVPAIFFEIKQFTSLSPWSKIVNLIPNANLKNLIFQGSISVENDVILRVTNADRGVLFKNIWWKDFQTRLKFNFGGLKSSIKDWGNGNMNTYNNYFGFVFRAKDLDNYFMFQVGIKMIPKQRLGDDYQQAEENYLLVRPHIRFKGEWEGFKEVRAPLNGFDVNIFNSLSCTVKGNMATLDFNGGRVVLNWHLPTNFGTVVKEKNNEFTFGDTSLITFRNEFGMVGFRAYGDEKVLIKDIEVHQL